MVVAVAMAMAMAMAGPGLGPHTPTTTRSPIYTPYKKNVRVRRTSVRLSVRLSVCLRRSVSLNQYTLFQLTFYFLVRFLFFGRISVVGCGKELGWKIVMKN